MRTKPWSLIILAILHALAPCGSFIFNAYWAGRTLLQQWHYWIDVLPPALLFIYVVLPMMAGLFIFICRRWAYWAYFACISTILLSNIYSFYTNLTLGTFLLLMIVAVVDLLVVSYFLASPVQQIYFDPKMRWWEAAPRYRFDVEGTVNGEKAFLKNLSQGGLYFTSGPQIAEGNKVEISWNYKGKEQIISGLLVYKSMNKNELGSGVRFDHTEETHKQVKYFVDQLQAEGLIVTERLPGPQDSFLSWLKKLILRGEGLFPKTR